MSVDTKHEKGNHLHETLSLCLLAFSVFCRSHIVVEKGGKVLDIRIGISPADSFGEAVKTVAAASN